MNGLKGLLAFVAVALIAGVASAQCGQQRVIDPTNAFLGSGVGVSVQGGGCANGQCNAGVSTSSAASVSALQSEVRALNARIAAMSRPAGVRVYAAPTRIASYQTYDVGGGGGASASSAAGSASSSASASAAPRAPRSLYVVPSSVYAMDVDASAATSASVAVDVAPSVSLVPLSATDVQVAAGGGGGRIRGLFRGRSRSRSVSVSVARN